MSDFFSDSSKAENIQQYLSSIDLTNADISQIEKNLLAATRTAELNKLWHRTPLAPLAEPLNLQELIGDDLLNAQQELAYQSRRTDNIYKKLSEVNNSLTSQIESLERIVTNTTKSVQEITQVASQDPQFYFWVSDTFNDNTQIDPLTTTALVDTDHGIVTLSPIQVENVDSISVEVIKPETVGIPGSNLLIIDQGQLGGPEKEPQPILEKPTNTNFANILDNDPNTWFEIERNFIPPKQKLTRFGRSFVWSPSGTEQDVKSVTSDLDWKAYVQWWDSNIPDTGDDGKGVQLAEFKDVVDSAQVKNQTTIQITKNDNRALLALRIILNNPTPLSYINLIPFERENQKIIVSSIKVFAQGQEIEIARNVVATPSQTNVSLLNKEILRRTGSQSLGGIFSIPTSKKIEKIEIRLSSSPIPTRYGLAHKFSEKLEHTRVEQRLVFFSIVNHEDTWSRIPVNETPIQIAATYSSNILGSLPQNLKDTLGLGILLSNQANMFAGSINKLGQGLSGLLQSLGQKVAGSNIGQQLGSLAGLGGLGNLGAILGPVGAIFQGLDLVKNIAETYFFRNKEVSVTETRTGYDIFSGHRASVGIRSVGLLKIQYNPISQIQTIRREFPSPVKKIGLFVEEHIPQTWGPGDWITYYISVDGENWTVINKSTDVTIGEGFEPEVPTKFVYLRAVIKGNPDDQWTSPSFKFYALPGVPA